MKTRAFLTLGLSTLAFAGTMAAFGEGSAFAGASDPTKMAQQKNDAARKALARGEAEAAVTFAEAAVTYDPGVVGYRVMLGQAYLKAGRFVSARAAFGDALVLEPTNGKAALNLALAEIAAGDWDGARRTLDAHATTIAVRDRGLAIALAGDPASAVELLGTAVRAPDADAKTRQNFALALALAGRWQDAKTVAAMDVAPDQLDARILQWAAFANPTSASDQVASLLGVVPVVDPGQPVALALAPAGDRNVALAAAAPVDTFMPKAQPEVMAVAAEQNVPVPAAPEPVMASVSSVSFAPRREVVQTLPTRAVNSVAIKIQPTSDATPADAIIARTRSAVAAFVVPKAKPARAGAAPAKGDYFVQLGAFDNAAVAKDAWTRARRVSSFGGHAPSGANFTGKTGTFYRLSVGGFARGEADAMCRSYRAKGGKCFVRTGAGDSAPAWLKVPVATLKRAAKVAGTSGSKGSRKG